MSCPCAEYDKVRECEIRHLILKRLVEWKIAYMYSVASPNFHCRLGCGLALELRAGWILENFA